MSIEYRDGTFSDNMPSQEALEKFEKEMTTGRVRSLHIGSERELDAIKEEKNLKQDIGELKTRLEALEEGPVESSSVIIPTRDEMVMALRNKR